MSISEAVKLIYSIYKDPVLGRMKKKEFDQNVGLHEVLLESLPTAFIITVIWVKSNSGKKKDFLKKSPMSCIKITVYKTSSSVVEHYSTQPSNSS